MIARCKKNYLVLEMMIVIAIFSAIIVPTLLKPCTLLRDNRQNMVAIELRRLFLLEVASLREELFKKKRLCSYHEYDTIQLLDCDVLIKKDIKITEYKDSKGRAFKAAITFHVLSDFYKNSCFKDKVYLCTPNYVVSY